MRLIPRLQLRIVVAIVAVLAIVVAVIAWRASSNDSRAKHRNPEQPTQPVTNKAGLTLVKGPVVVQNAGRPASVGQPVQRVVMNAAQAYVDDAILAPLERGGVVDAYAKMLDPRMKSAASHADRNALTEAKTGLARGPVHATASRVRLDALGDQNGQVALVAATFTMNVKATIPAGNLTIRRHTELTFANEFGKWFVTAYRVTVRRSLGAKAATTSAHAAIGTTT